jgi:hypothetical protein
MLRAQRCFPSQAKHPRSDATTIAVPDALKARIELDPGRLA